MKYLLPILLFLFISCEKDYTCSCDADGVAPVQDDYIIQVWAKSKKEATEKCRDLGDECGLYQP